MTTITTAERSRSRFDSRRRPRRGPGAVDHRGEDGSPSLEDVIVATWGDLVEHGQATCPVCSGTALAPSHCADCGSRLF